MTTEQIWLTGLGAIALLALVAALLAVRVARRALAQARELATRAQSAPAPAEVSPPVEDPAPASAPESAYVITGIDDEDEMASVPERIDGRLFVDIVARETLVKAASWTHGLRRALAAETRNRIGFEVRQQTRRARKDRKAEMREALRHYRARHRVDAPGTHATDDEDAA